MKKVTIGLIGSSGRMGNILIKKIKKNKKFILLKDSNKNNYYSIIKNSNIIIDFSHPKLTIKIINLAKKLKKNIVIGTTGFKKEQENQIKKASKKIAIFKSGNMSLGINILQYITKILSKKIPNNFQISIEDNHHKKKIDYPSGTALMLADSIAKGKSKKLNLIKGKIFFNKRKKIKKKNKINFFITRKGNTVGIHNVKFNNNIESIELKHQAFSRDLFADGAINAALWLRKKNKGLFSMQDLLNLK